MNEVGFVRVTALDITDGALDAASGDERLPAPYPFGSSAHQFGWSVAPANIRESHTTNPGTYDGVGQEILIGAPSISNTQQTGRVFWYETDGDGNSDWQYGGPVAVPSGATAGAQFGYAIAAAHEAPDAAAPWAMGSASVNFVAVGAPGEDKVYLYAVDPTSYTPLTLQQTLTAPVSGRRFGHALAVGDFDNDGIWDLAVGAPGPDGTDVVGRVWVYRGVSSTAWPRLRYNAVELSGADINAGSSTGDENAFGWSLAAGQFIGFNASDSLIVGAPLAGAGDDGGVCQYAFLPRSTSPYLDVWSTYRLCMVNPWLSASGSAVENWGYAVAVGNVQNNDSQVMSDSPEAELGEVLVGRPGAADGSASGAGLVDVMLTNDLGFQVTEMATSVGLYGGSVSNGRFGTSVAVGYVQETDWTDVVAGAPDVVVGPYVDGATSVSKALEVATCTEINGTYSLLDSDGDPRDVKLANTADSLKMTFLQDFAVDIKKGRGTSQEEVCTFYLGPVEGSVDLAGVLQTGTSLEMPAPWGCSTTQAWPDVDLTSLISSMTRVEFAAGTFEGSVELTRDGSTGDVDFTLSSPLIDHPATLGLDPDCSFSLSSGALEAVNPGSCE